MRRREFVAILAGVASFSQQLQATESTQAVVKVWNWTERPLEILVDSIRQLPLWVNGGESYTVGFGDHRLEAYRDSDYYRLDFRLSPTTPYREVTITDKDF